MLFLLICIGKYNNIYIFFDSCFLFHDTKKADINMNKYNIILAHGPVIKTEYIGNDTVVYTLEDAGKYTIRFSITDGAEGRSLRRDIKDSGGNEFSDESGFDDFGDAFTTEDYAQWTADNFCEIEELAGYYTEAT